MIERDSGNEGEPQSRTLASTSQSLLDRIRLGSEDDQRLLIALYFPLVMHVYINQKIVERLEDRLEINNRVFLAVFRRIERDGFVRQGRGAFRAWLKTITRNKVGDFIRQRRRKELKETNLNEQRTRFAGLIEDCDQGVEGDIERVLLVRQAMEVVRDQFEPTTFEMARLQLVENLSAAEAGVTCGRSVNAATIAKSRVKSRFREVLARFEIWDEHGGMEEAGGIQ